MIRLGLLRTPLGYLTRLTLALVLTVPLLVSNSHPAKAATNVGGPISSSTTWTLANSPYVVTASVDVLAGVTLTIQPGVMVRFNSGTSLQINGKLVAQGNSSQLIVFTSNQSGPAPKDWGGVLFTASAVPSTVDANGNYLSGSILKYCAVQFGGQNVTAAITAQSLLIDHCTVNYNGSQGIVNPGAPGKPSWTTNNTIRYNTPIFNPYYGLTVSDGMVIGNTIADNSHQGVYIGDNVLVKDNTIARNGADGVYVKQASTGGEIESNTIYRNGARGISIPNNGLNISIKLNEISNNWGGIFVGGYSIPSSGIVIADNVIRGNIESSDGGAGIYISESTGVTITSNTIDNNSAKQTGAAATGGGILLSNSHDVFVLDNTVTRNTDQGVCGGICSEGWGNTSVISGNIVANNVGGGIRVADGDNLVQGNFVTDNTGGWGIKASNITGSPTCYIRNNVIANNTADLSTDNGAGASVYQCTDFSWNVVIGNTGSAGAKAGGLDIYRTPQVHGNTFYANTPFDVSITVGSTEVVSGTNNYWGTSDTAQINSRIWDKNDNPSLGQFLYDPFLSEPSPEGPFPPPLGLTGIFVDGSMSLSWQPLPIFPPGWGYKVYYDTDTFVPPFDGAGLAEGDAPIDVGTLNAFSLTGLDPRKDYYFTVTAYNDEGVESWYSNYVTVQGGSRTYLPIMRK